MALVLKIGSLDLSSYLRVAHDEGLDPTDSAFSELQFTGSPAFSEGQTGVGEALGNREQVYPLIVKADSATALHQLIRNINLALVKGAQVEYNADDSVNSSTFFDLEGGKFEAEYQFWITKANRTRGTLRLSVRPFGHTGTTRIIASVSATGGFQFSATGVGGDVKALANLRILKTAPSAAVGQTRMAMWGVHRSASFKAMWPAGSLVVAPSPIFGGAAASAALPTLTAASGAPGSQILRFSASNVSILQTMPIQLVVPHAGMAGRHRLFVFQQNLNVGPRTLFCSHLAGGDGRDAYIATAAASMFDNYGSGMWEMVDVGQINIAGPVGSLPMPTQVISIELYNSPSVIALGPRTLAIGGIYLLPLDENAGAHAGRVGSNRRPQPTYTQEWTSFESIPGDRAFIGSASNYFTQAIADLRGPLPRLPAQPSGSPSGPAQVAVIQGDPYRMNLSTPYNVELGVRERFRYLR